MYTTSALMNYTILGDKFINAIEKNSIGMDEWFAAFDTLHESSANYPPYNLIKESPTKFVVEIALAGYKKEDIEVSTEVNKLFVKCKKASAEPTYVHNGIARRSFTRTWSLSNDVVVSEVSFIDGLLTINLNRVVAEHHRKKVWF